MAEAQTGSARGRAWGLFDAQQAQMRLGNGHAPDNLRHAVGNAAEDGDDAALVAAVDYWIKPQFREAILEQLRQIARSAASWRSSPR